MWICVAVGADLGELGVDLCLAAGGDAEDGDRGGDAQGGQAGAQRPAAYAYQAAVAGTSQSSSGSSRPSRPTVWKTMCAMSSAPWSMAPRRTSTPHTGPHRRRAGCAARRAGGSADAVGGDRRAWLGECRLMLGDRYGGPAGRGRAGCRRGSSSTWPTAGLAGWGADAMRRTGTVGRGFEPAPRR